MFGTAVDFWLEYLALSDYMKHLHPDMNVIVSGQSQTAVGPGSCAVGPGGKVERLGGDVNCGRNTSRYYTKTLHSMQSPS